MCKVGGGNQKIQEKKGKEGVRFPYCPSEVAKKHGEEEEMMGGAHQIPSKGGRLKGRGGSKR